MGVMNKLVHVYHSLSISEYHWSTDCRLLGRGKRERGMVTCLVCIVEGVHLDEYLNWVAEQPDDDSSSSV